MAWKSPHCGVCASSAASGAAYWHSSGLPAGQSLSSESGGGTCPPTADWRPLLLVMGMMMFLGLMMKKLRRKGQAPSGLCDLSLSQVGCGHLCSGHCGLVPGRSLTGSGCVETWNYPWRERSSGTGGCSLMPCWEESWSLRLCSKKKKSTQSSYSTS